MLRDLKIGKKQALGFAVVLALMAGANIFSMYKMKALRDEFEHVTGDALPSVLAISAVNDNTSDLRIAQLQHATATTDSVKQRLREGMVALIERIEANQDAFEALAHAERERELYDRFESSWGRYLELSYQFYQLSIDRQDDRAIELLSGEAQDVFDEMTAALEALVIANQDAATEAARVVEETYRRARSGVRALFLFTIVVSGLIALWLARWTSVPVGRLAAAAGRVSEGDLEAEVKWRARDEIGRLAESFNRMTASLRDARARIERQQSELRAANTELAEKNRDLEDAMRQLRETQEQLVLSEKMASLGNLVAGVAHEINNPVGAVSSAADTSRRSIEIVTRLLEEAADLQTLRENHRFRTALDVLKSNNEITSTASDRITAIVHSLRNFARLDESEYQEADVHEGLDSTLTLLHHETKRRIEVVKEYGDLPRIQCYPNQLNQVFMNVLSNSIHAIEGEGRITVRTRRAGDRVVIEVEDTGKGIPKENLAKIFDPGFTTKGVGVGTGLGLSITYSIVRKHAGTITAASEVGKGTTMTITLPVTQQGVST